MMLTRHFFASLRKTANDLIDFGRRSAPAPHGDASRRRTAAPSPVAATRPDQSVPNSHGATIVTGQLDRKPVRLTGYQSLAQLGAQLKAIEGDASLPRPTVVLVLSRSFSGDIPSLIRRSTWTPRLVIVAERGSVALPRGMMPGDLAASEGALGWGQIVFERDLEAALTGSLQSLAQDESLVICWPAWQCPSVPLQFLRRNGCQLSQPEQS